MNFIHVSMNGHFNTLSKFKTVMLSRILRYSNRDEA